MIKGTGIDIVNISRIRKSLDEYGEKFIAKILSSEEIKIIPAARKEEFVAGRFSAKEALVKASGITFSFSSLSILNDEKGKPFIKTIPENMQEIIGDKTVHISISHDTDYAAAFIIIEE